jgi:uncharacterized protein with LGFP repeats
MSRSFGRGARSANRVATKSSVSASVPLIEPLEQRQLMSGTPITAVNGDPILLKYNALGGAKGILGKSTSAELSMQQLGILTITLPGQKVTSRYEKFANGAIFWSATTGVHDLYGAIATKYFSTATMKDSNGNSILQDLGLPTADEGKSTLVTGGLTAKFYAGEIDLIPSKTSPGFHPHVMTGPIFAEYKATAKEKDSNGISVQKDLGMPLTDEVDVPGVTGARMNLFQGGSIYWSKATGAHVVYGAIGAKYKAIGGPAAYGLPVADEAVAFGDATLRVSNFTGGDSIYWSAATGAHTVYGDIGKEYIATQDELDYYGNDVRSVLGAPTSDEMGVRGLPGVRVNTFHGGVIVWSAATGAHEVSGEIGARYLEMGGPMSYLGLPTTDEQKIAGGMETAFYDSLPETIVGYFQGGKIVWNGDGGAVDVQTVSQMDFSTGYLSSIGGSPVSGYESLTIYADGTYHFWGSFHDAGFLDASVSVGITVESLSGVDYDFFNRGDMGGTLSPASRDFSWDWSGTYPGLSAGWTDLEGGQYQPMIDVIYAGVSTTW